MDSSDVDFETLAVQAGLHVRVGDTISTVPPIDASTTFTGESIADVHAALGPDPHGFAYARNGNPTVVGFEGAMARLEGAEDVVAFGSGMAAIYASFVGLGLQAGDAVVAASDVYGVSRGALTQLAGFDIETHLVDVLQPDVVDETLERTRARILFFETISNPLLRIPNVAMLCAIARKHRAQVIVDNTFATPYLFRPLEYGAHVVVHSATKYVAGHGDVLAGLAATDRSRARRIREARSLAGGVLSPFEAWLTLRGVRTLPLRVARQSESASTIASWLRSRPWIEHVYYPGLSDHPQYSIAAQQFGGRFGGMVAFDLRGGQDDALAFMDRLRLITPGTSLGDVQSLALYPALSSHRTLTTEEQHTAGIGPGLIRLSVGLESPRDLMADLDRAGSPHAQVEHVIGSV